PVENLAVEWKRPYPWAELTWSRDTAPDSFIIARGGNVIAQPTPDQVDIGNGKYRFIDRRATLNRELRWTVLPVVNNQMSRLETASVKATIESTGIWLVNENRAAANSGVLIF